MIAFLAIALSVFGLLYGYTGWRLLAPLRLGVGWNLAAALAILTLMLMPWLLRFRGLSLPGWLHDRLVWIAYVTLAFVLLTWLMLIARDLSWLLLAGSRRVCSALGWWPQLAAAGPVDTVRRSFMLNATNLGVVGLSTALVGLGLRNARRDIRVERVSVPIPDLPPQLDGLRIIQISDLHVGLTIRRPFVERIVRKVESLDADLIAFTGDMVDGEVADLRDDVAPLARLRAPLGCFFSTGNHEYYNSDPQAWLDQIRGMGYDVLLNDHRVIQRGGARLVIAGVTDFGAGGINAAHRSSPSAAVDGAPSQSTIVLLAHQPRSIDEAAAAGCNLQLSGHTHGGQFMPWNYAVPLQQPYVEGLHRHRDTWIYVNRGVGYWGPPMRLGAPAEITLLTLTGATDHGPL
jgi:uncharacterized protein